MPQKFPNIGVAAFVDFFDVKGAIEAKEAKLKWNGSELRANFKFDKNEGSGKPQEKQDGKTRYCAFNLCCCIVVLLRFASLRVPLSCLAADEVIAVLL